MYEMYEMYGKECEEGLELLPFEEYCRNNNITYIEGDYDIWARHVGEYMDFCTDNNFEWMPPIAIVKLFK